MSMRIMRTNNEKKKLKFKFKHRPYRTKQNHKKQKIRTWNVQTKMQFFFIVIKHENVNTKWIKLKYGTRLYLVLMLNILR
jgi:hypothetical protein